MRVQPLVYACASVLALSLSIGSASAATYNYLASGNSSDGPISASALITTGVNSLTVALSSLIANPTSAGQEVSGIKITLASAPSSVSLTSSSGSLIDIKNGVATPAAGTIDHWGVAQSGTNIFLATAGTGSEGGKPIDLIIGPGPYTNANPSITGRNPQISLTGTFVLSLFGLSNPIISSVLFEFGTGPDLTLAGTLIATPLPAALPLFAGALGGMGLIGWRRKRKAAVSAAA